MLSVPRWTLLLTALMLMASSGLTAGVPDLSFNAHVETTTYLDKRVSSLIACPDGKIVAAGTFNTYNGQHVGGLIRLNPDGTLDPTFNNNLFVSPITPIMLLDSSGRLLVAGSFTFTDGTSYTNKILRLNQDGTLDNSFVYQLTGSIHDFKIDAAGRIVVGSGSALHYDQNGISIASRYFRLFDNGDVDLSFSPQLLGNATANLVFTATQDNKLLYLGFDSANGQQKIFRINEDGSPDNSFDCVISNVHSITEQIDHKILVLLDKQLIRLNQDGSMDAGFTQPATFQSFSRQLFLQNDGRITVSHTLTSPNGMRIRRFLPSGLPDPSFTAYDIFDIFQPSICALFGDGSVVNGDGSDGSTPSNKFIRLLPSGIQDPTFNINGTGFQSVRAGKVRTIRVQADGKILIGGDFDRVAGAVRAKIARLNSDSSLDSSFQVNTIASGNYFSTLTDVYNITAQGDGKVLISGRFAYFVNGVQKQNVVRLLSDGTIDPTFVPSLIINEYFSVTSLSTNKPVQSADQKVLVGTTRLSLTDTMSTPLLLDVGGTRVTSFNPGLFASSNTVVVFDLAVQSDGKILVAGRNDNIVGVNSISSGFIARLNSDGTTDTAFQRLEFNGQPVFALSVLSNGQILIVTRTLSQSLVYRLNSDGTVDGSFNTGAGANGKINALEVLASGKLIVAGLFTTYNGQPRRNLAMLNSDGSLDSDLGLVNGEVLCVTVDGQGRMLIGGQFTSIGSGNQQATIPYLARISITTPHAPLDFDGDGKTDVSVFRPSSNIWYLNRSTSGFTGYQFGTAGDVLTPADFTGDGKTDVAVFRPSEGMWYVLRSEDNSFYGAEFGTSGDIPVPNDYDRDGKADLAVFRPSDGTWYLQQSTAGFSATQFGASGDRPTLGDFDGDGKADIAVFRPSTGVWYRLNSSDGSFFAAEFGMSTDKVVPADYTGDGKTDIAVWRPSDGTWYVLKSEDLSFYGAQFGMTGDMPVPGDYDGDGTADFAVYRPSEGIWYEQRSTSGFTAFPFGTAEDKPAPNAFVY